jgi:rare lipoprotein A
MSKIILAICIMINSYCIINAQTGMASYYANMLKGRKTYSGEHYDPDKLTCAHRTLPMGTLVKITCLKTKKNVICKVNDRGPHRKKYMIDLSYSAAKELGFIRAGKCEVEIEVVKNEYKIETK